MKSENQEVRIRSKNAQGVMESRVVGIATYPVFDSVDEAVGEIGEEKVRELINAQARTNEMNRVRGLNRPGGASKTLLRNKALARITAEEFVECAGDESAINALIEKHMEAVREELLAGQPVGVGADDEDENS